MVWIALSPSVTQAPARATTSEDTLARARIQRLETEAEELRGELERTRSDLSAVRGAVLAMAPPQGPEGKGVEAYLDEYARSFDGGGRGSEYFRLVVEAYAPALKDSILRKIADPALPIVLRAGLIAMLGRADLKGDGVVIAALLAVLRAEPQLAQPAAQALRVIGDARTGLALETLVFDLPPSAKAFALHVAVDLSAETNATVARLLGGAHDASTKQQLLNLLVAGDDEHAVLAFRDASRMEQPVRLFAAHKLGTFRGDPFRRLADDWLGYEADPAVQAALRKARDQQSGIPNWHALKATGPPDADPPSNDHPNAWATREQDKGREWIELVYDPPRRASAVRVFEVNVAGAVVEVETVDEGGTRRSVWKGADPTATPGVFEIPFAATGYRVRSVRIILDTSKRPGWEEIDAVELVGPDGRGWATGASASSSYAQG